ncbi:MAG: DUF4388 domain-containing protein [Acidobacteriota bacterium]
MIEEPRERELLEALGDLDQYLSDAVAPLLAADSVSLLIRCAPRLVAERIETWASQQFQAHEASVRISDFLFHAVKKLQQMGELGLVDQRSLDHYLNQLKETVISHCPASERGLLRDNFSRLAEVQTTPTQPVELLFRQQEGESSPSSTPPDVASDDSTQGTAFTEEETRKLRRFAVLLDRLDAMPAPVVGGQLSAKEAGEWELASQLFVTAAENAQNGTELREYLDRLRRAGMREVQAEEVIRTLVRSLPNWVVPFEPGERTYHGRSAEAVRRIVTLAEDPAEGAERFRQMVKAGIEQFNTGSFARAVTIFQLAERIIAEEEVDAGTVKLVRGSAHESLDPNRLRESASDPDHHPLLRKILTFFPALRPKVLLSALESQADRQQRRLLLTLLEVHGEDIRPPVLERLEGSLADMQADSWQLQRNLIYLLRRLPPPEKGVEEREIDTIYRLSELRHPAPLVREALAYLGHVADERAEQALTARLRELETLLEKPERSIYGLEEARRLLTLVTASLARFGTTSARKAVVEHGLKQAPHLGNTAERLAELRVVDLSDDPELVQPLLDALKSLVPVKVLGFSIRGDEDKLSHLVDALSGTSLPEVRQAFDELVRRFPGHAFAHAAANALRRFDTAEGTAKAAPGGRLEGDVEIFGLPNLLQNLAQTQVSGVLTLRDRNGKAVADLRFRDGGLSVCRSGRLEGEPAFYELLEKPLSATFHFSAQPPAESEPENGACLDVMHLMFEGMRRYDELQRARAVVPDDARLKPTGTEPATVADESHGALVQDVWAKVQTGATPRECEDSIVADSYAVRTLLAHWVEAGALKVA